MDWRFKRPLNAHLFDWWYTALTFFLFFLGAVCKLSYLLTDLWRSTVLSDLKRSDWRAESPTSSFNDHPQRRQTNLICLIARINQRRSADVEEEEGRWVDNVRREWVRSAIMTGLLPLKRWRTVLVGNCQSRPHCLLLLHNTHRHHLLENHHVRSLRNARASVQFVCLDSNRIQSKHYVQYNIINII